MATELAKAYVQIVPSAEGMKGMITKELGGEADSAGKSGWHRDGFESSHHRGCSPGTVHRWY